MKIEVYAEEKIDFPNILNRDGKKEYVDQIVQVMRTRLGLRRGDRIIYHVKWIDAKTENVYEDLDDEVKRTEKREGF